MSSTKSILPFLQCMSALVEPEFYLRTNPDVREAGLDPVDHFARFGAVEGRRPNPLFDQAWYLGQLDEFERSEAGIAPLLHYFQVGARLLLSPHPLLDARWYVENCPEEEREAARQNPLGHYLEVGADQDLAPHPLFDPGYYKDQCLELGLDIPEEPVLVHYIENGRSLDISPHPLFDPVRYAKELGTANEPPASMTALEHYVRQGPRTKSSPHALFDAAFYAKTHPGLKEPGLIHYIRQGWLLADKPHPLFDPDYYLANYTDVAKSGMNPLLHFISFGQIEGRRPHPLFDPRCYLRNCPQALREKARVTPLEHYQSVGAAKLLPPHPLFDPAWYLDQCSVEERARAASAPLEHYLAEKNVLEISPHPLFDPGWYLARLDETEKKAALTSPLGHYIATGTAKGISPHPLFSPEYYARQWPRSKRGAAIRGGLVHYLVVGANFSPHPLFDSKFYAHEYPAIKEPGLVHYCRTGWKEGLRPNPVFAPGYYFRKNSDLDPGKINPLLHYACFGRFEGRVAHPWFDAKFYAAQRPDSPRIADALIHYLHTGAMEGTHCHPRYHGLHFRAHPDEAFADALPDHPLEMDVLISLEGSLDNIKILAATLNQQKGVILNCWLLGTDKAIDAAKRAGIEGTGVEARPGSDICRVLNKLLPEINSETAVLVRPYHAFGRGCLASMAKRLNESPQTGAVYADHAATDARGFVASLFFKPSWDQDLFRARPYTGSLLAFKPGAALKAGGFSSALHAVRESDILLKLVNDGAAVQHLEGIRYYCRGTPGQPRPEYFLSSEQKAQWTEAVGNHLRRQGSRHMVRRSAAQGFSLELASIDPRSGPTISIVLKGDGAKEAFQRLAPCIPTDFEVLAAPGVGAAPARFKGVKWGNLSAEDAISLANQAAEKASMDLLFFLMDAIPQQPEGWLAGFLAHAAQPGVAAVGPLVLDGKGRIISAGYALSEEVGGRSIAIGESHSGITAAGWLAFPRRVSALSLSGLAIRRVPFLGAGGLNSDYGGLADFDLGLRLADKGHRLLFYPGAKVRTYGNVHPPTLLDRALVVDTWRQRLKGDDPFLYSLQGAGTAHAASN